MREAQIKKYPYNLILGQKEVDDDAVSFRPYSKDETTTMKKDEFISMIEKEINVKKR